MAQHRLTVSALIQAPVAKVYGIIADYHNGHPNILPEPYFADLTVKQGGIGAGAVIRFQMKLMGKAQMFHAAVTEPEPGRVPVETTNTGAVTIFAVEPRDNGQHAHVSITTDTQIPGGLLGTVQGWLTSRLFRSIYLKELAQLAAFAAR